MYVHVCLVIYNCGREPLSRAAGNGHEAVVKLLLDQGTEVNTDCGKGGFDALQAAAYGGHEAVADADIWKEGLYGTAHGAAAFAGYKAVIEQLLDYGTDKNLVDSHGRNPLPLAQALHSRYAGSFRPRIGPRTHAA